jgi:hypothetical protein
MEMAEKYHPFIETGYSSLIHLWKRYELKAAVAESVRQLTELEIYKRHQPIRTL